MKQVDKLMIRVEWVSKFQMSSGKELFAKILCDLVRKKDAMKSKRMLHKIEIEIF